MNLNKKVTNKDEAHQLLFKLANNIQETMMFIPSREINFYQVAYSKINAMRNSINAPNNDFYDVYFHNKTYGEIIDWINSESKKWYL